MISSKAELYGFKHSVLLSNNKTYCEYYVPLTCFTIFRMTLAIRLNTRDHQTYFNKILSLAKQSNGPISVFFSGNSSCTGNCNKICTCIILWMRQLLTYLIIILMVILTIFQSKRSFLPCRWKVIRHSLFIVRKQQRLNMKTVPDCLFYFFYCACLFCWSSQFIALMYTGMFCRPF